MNIGIVGGTGGMGRLFTGVFTRAGHEVTICGRTTGPSPEELARSSDVVVISVPIADTSDMIRRVGPAMAADALLTDLTSLKVEPVRVMLEASPVAVVGMHPLCGPTVESLHEQNVVLCPGRGERWLVWLREVIEADGARVVETNPATHDERMAVVQGLNHFHSLLMGLMLTRTGVPVADLEPFTTVAFRAKLDLLRKVGQAPDLYTHLVTDNPQVATLVANCRPDVEAAFDAAVAGDQSELRRLIEAAVDSLSSSW
jgi:prephenate dehydrogenase